MGATARLEKCRGRLEEKAALRQAISRAKLFVLDERRIIFLQRSNWALC